MATNWKLLAAEARTLADECVNGSAPPLIPHELEYEGRHCVAGLLGKRAFSDVYRVLNVFPHYTEGAAAVDAMIDANNQASDEDRHGAVVFPLLWVADACDEAAASEPERA